MFDKSMKIEEMGILEKEHEDWGYASHAEKEEEMGMLAGNEEEMGMFYFMAGFLSLGRKQMFYAVARSVCLNLYLSKPSFINHHNPLKINL